MSNIISKAVKTAYNTVFRAVQRRDLTPWEHEPDMAMPVYGVYHVFCDKGWRELVADQIGRLKASGLWKNTTRFYVSCIVKDRREADELRRMIGEDKTELVAVETDPMKFEYPALEFMRAKSRDEDCLFYYFHTKGVSYYGGDRTDGNCCKAATILTAVTACLLIPSRIICMQATSGGCAPAMCAACPRSPKSASPPTASLPRSGCTRPGRGIFRRSTRWQTFIMYILTRLFTPRRSSPC